MSFERDFEKNLKQLMQLLKKMMAQYPNMGKGEELSKLLKNQKNSPDINIFFLNLAPLSGEDLDELEKQGESKWNGVYCLQPTLRRTTQDTQLTGHPTASWSGEPSVR